MPDFGPEALYEQCARVLAKRGWKLVSDPAQFVRAVLDDLAERQASETSGLTAEAIERATVHCYCIILYKACAQASRPEQQQAFTELWAHLYRAALYKTHQSQSAQDAAQQALVNIWRHLDQCRDPGSFLNWCNLILVNVIRERFRKERKRNEQEAEQTWPREEIYLIQTGNYEPEPPEDALVDPDSESETLGLDRAARAELNVQLVAAIRRCLKSVTQQQVLFEIFFNERTNKEVAEQLGTTPGNIQVLKSRALKTLRECKAFNQLYEEWTDVPPS